jgi:hypothetical protein
MLDARRSACSVRRLTPRQCVDYPANERRRTLGQIATLHDNATSAPPDESQLNWKPNAKDVGRDAPWHTGHAAPRLSPPA